MMLHPSTRKIAAEPDAALSDAGSLPDDPEEIHRRMEAYRAYLLLVANQEISPVLRPKGGASDLVQETYLEAYRDFSQFSGRSPGELKGWLRRILRNNLANFFRRYQGAGKRRVGREVSLDGDPAGGQAWEGLTSSSPSPSQLAILREQTARLDRALGLLRERDRLVLVWRNQDYCDWKEIGRRIGGSEDKARKIWKRAVDRLRQAVGDGPASTPGNPF
jgi:RNA polymerase sigma-70 factor (ECF subfamily)